MLINWLFICILFQLGYVVYRRVLRYYSGEEDALGELSYYITNESL